MLQYERERDRDDWDKEYVFLYIIYLQYSSQTSYINAAKNFNYFTFITLGEYNKIKKGLLYAHIFQVFSCIKVFLLLKVSLSESLSRLVFLFLSLSGFVAIDQEINH